MSVAETLLCHPELVSGALNILKRIGSEINSEITFLIFRLSATESSQDTLLVQ